MHRIFIYKYTRIHSHYSQAICSFRNCKQRKYFNLSISHADRFCITTGDSITTTGATTSVQRPNKKHGSLTLKSGSMNAKISWKQRRKQFIQSIANKLPINQLNEPPSVLNEEEREGLNSERKVRVLMLDPSCINTASYYVYLGKVYYNYYLGLNWFEVVQRNDLREGMVVQLWSFRVGSDPCFALVLEDKQNYGGDVKC